MNPLQNIVKGWITTTIGTLVILLTLVLIVLGTMPVFWEGSFLIFIGGLFLIAPDKFSGIVDAVVQKKTGITITEKTTESKTETRTVETPEKPKTE